MSGQYEPDDPEAICDKCAQIRFDKYVAHFIAKGLPCDKHPRVVVWSPSVLAPLTYGTNAAWIPLMPWSVGSRHGERDR
jgi:hypothetical protein